ncbi:MAG: hypothetical protein MMC33_009981, partial [Icmadophila ericetorum]|nr:hypothetical protein [Icmadophila ericetorum]
MDSIPTLPSTFTGLSMSTSLETPMQSPAPISPLVPIEYPEPPDEFVQDHTTYVNRATIAKKTACL